ncbi:protein FAM162A [Fopius arisanus]|uniref:Protein FAM162A n=1 Tax=Fopius arisanus TaxID=64838 RepID=A0A9R1T6M4_9HYME|nr:PREDICTED: protein FAM162A-like [Fopius arisanus]
MNHLVTCRFLRNSLRSTNSLKPLRNFSSSRLLRDSKPTVNKTDENTVLGTFKHKVTNFDKWILVTMKKFPTKDQVPQYVPDDIMQSAMSKARIRAMNIMMVVTILYAFYIVVTSKKAQQEHAKTLDYTREDYRKQITEEFRQKLTEDSAKKTQ